MFDALKFFDELTLDRYYITYVNNNNYYYYTRVFPSLSTRAEERIRGNQ